MKKEIIDYPEIDWDYVQAYIMPESNDYRTLEEILQDDHLNGYSLDPD